jgi:8-oxo-dGTP pyrophosphatase MutT (NUDIX family)
VLLEGMGKDRKTSNPSASAEIPPVLYAAVSRKELVRALRKGRLRHRKGRPLPLYTERERASRSRHAAVVLRVDVPACTSLGVPIVVARGRFSAEKLPLRVLSCSKVPRSATDVRVVEAAGGVVIRDGRDPRVLVLRKVDGRTDSWVLPKGKRRRSEDEVETARREVAEETGLETLVVDTFLAREQYLETKNGPCEFKRVAYYLMRCSADVARPVVSRKEGFTDARWMTFEEALRVTKPLRAHRALRRARRVLVRSA